MKPQIDITLHARVRVVEIGHKFNWRKLRWEHWVMLESEIPYGNDGGPSIDRLCETDQLVLAPRYQMY